VAEARPLTSVPIDVPALGAAPGHPASTTGGADGPGDRLLVLCPQGGRPEAEFNAAIAAALVKAGARRVDVSVVCLRESDAETIRALAPAVHVAESFERFHDRTPAPDLAAETLRLARDYADVNWWAIAAAERSFVDSSFLIGGLGQRSESQEYVEALIVGLVRHLEAVFSEGRYSAAVCQAADSLMSYIFHQVARRFAAQLLVLSPNAWIREDGKPGFYIGYDEFMHNARMEAHYRELGHRPLREDERQRSRRFQQTVRDFEITRAFRSIMNRPFIVPAVSPNLRRLWTYLHENTARRKEIEYYKIDVAAKARANMLRVWRRWRSRRLLGSSVPAIPPRSVFYPMQYQPEQTTLVGGIYFANQVALVENLAKALPFGCTLVVKEHPRGRGARPAWQYRHLAHFPNVRFCDADAKEIIRRCEAVVTITSTVGLEAMALDRPVIVLGNCYYDFADVVYRPKNWPELAQALKRILIDGEYRSNAARGEWIDRFFLAYLRARVPAALSRDSADAVAEGLLAELEARRNPAVAAAAQY
jgi:hypothetical protein